MIKIKFYLHDKNAQKSNIIISLFYTERVRFSTGRSIETKFWDHKKQKPKVGLKSYQKYNQIINAAEITLNEYNESKIFSKDYNLEEAKQLILKAINNKPHKKIQEDFLQEFFKWNDEKRRLGQSAETTHHKLKTVGRLFNTFMQYNNLSYNLEDITDDVLKEYHYFLNTVSYNNRKDLTVSDKKISSNSTASKHISRLRQFLKESGHNNTTYRINFKTYPQPVLNEKELELLENFNSPYPSIENTRKLFLIEIYSALRVSDLKQLFKNIIVDFDEEVLKFPVQKGGKYIRIPFLGGIEKLLREFEAGEIHMISDVKYNEYLKALFLQLGIDRKWQVIKEIGGDRIVESKPLYELISSHVARRTFATISYKKGMYPEEIIKITGHSTTREIQPYINLVDEEAFDKAKKVWG